MVKKLNALMKYENISPWSLHPYEVSSVHTFTHYYSEINLNINADIAFGF